jgi:formylglycine-generating enzyme required for sulfatase activity
VCWKRWHSQLGTCPVGTHAAGDSPFGLHDMAGNVWEWTATRVASHDADAEGGSLQVLRGGSWGDVEPEDFAVNTRGARPPSLRSTNYGFRCAR